MLVVGTNIRKTTTRYCQKQTRQKTVLPLYFIDWSQPSCSKACVAEVRVHINIMFLADCVDFRDRKWSTCWLTTRSGYSFTSQFSKFLFFFCVRIYMYKEKQLIRENLNILQSIDKFNTCIWFINFPLSFIFFIF